MLQSTTKKSPIDKATLQKILSSVPYEHGFHFFRGIGSYTGETAVNLFSFNEELRTIEPQSVRFHFERKDFQNWIRETLDDVELADRIDRIPKKLSDENLKRELLKTVHARFEELQILSKLP
jgi:hypothetical protein